MRRSADTIIAGITLVGIAAHLMLHYGLEMSGSWLGLRIDLLPLFVSLLAGVPLLFGLAVRLKHLQFGSDLLAGVSIVTAVVLGEYLAAAVIVLMLSGGQALEAYAIRSASSALEALARRLPPLAHLAADGEVVDVSLDRVAPGDVLVVFPHEACPVDGVVVSGRSSMDESYLTGEPYVLSKAPGSTVLSGAINGDGALRIRADKTAVDSRYAKIMQVMREAERRRPYLRRLGDQLGAIYNPVAMGIAGLTWAATGDVTRFLSVLVVATPCPLILAIPVAIVGSVSLAARRGIVVKDPTLLERIGRCRTAIFDKTGTLTYGEAKLTAVIVSGGVSERHLLGMVASLERYSRHPLATAIIEAAREAGASLQDAEAVNERPRGRAAGRRGRPRGSGDQPAAVPQPAGWVG